MKQYILIGNNGPEITYTNYWELEQARRGLCYLSANAGDWRLLVPPEAETMLSEMRTGKTATLEPSLHMQDHIDIVFEDGTDSPFSVAINPMQADRQIEKGKTTLHVYSRRGLEMSLPLRINVK